ncbi:hypothetical protein K435DRAFT_273113 [Dendrothele bispora CBS 962.96]|uniref:Uncharacterized protein n=1 Tax=Dendrothele bispora (strain CBS 962.96) TaxID=1314807 RepID=A0A4S8LM03_DENBC|nr:hypothetical protein K435DRAFT_273113 [Dendrothele bispora CBS 962.96]
MPRPILLQICGFEIQQMIHGLFVLLPIHSILSSFPLCVICSSRPSLVSFVNFFICSAVLLAPEVGGRFFVAFTSLTRWVPNPRKGSEKGNGRKTRRNTRCNLDLSVQWVSRRAWIGIRVDFQDPPIPFHRWATPRGEQIIQYKDSPETFVAIVSFSI